MNAKNYWLYQPGENARLWETYLNESIIGLGWDKLGDLSKYISKDEIVQQLQVIYNTDSSKKNDATANWDFYKTMQVGDFILVKKGKRKLLGYGVVVSDYYYDAERDEYTSIRDVKWIKSGEWNLKFDLVLKTLTNITLYDSEISKGQKYYDYLLSIMNGTDTIEDNKILQLLTYKKQIILQGPPGTGKTKLAKEIAAEMNSLDYRDIGVYLSSGDEIKTYNGSATYIIDSIEQYSITLIGDDIEPKKVSFAKLLKYFHSKRWLKEIKNGDERGACALAYHLYTLMAKNDKHIKVLQFHPSYTYEDLVRGIVSKPSADGDGIIYEAEDKTLGKFAKEALDNYLGSLTPQIDLEEKDSFDAFIDYLKEEIAQSVDHKYNITDAVYLFSADETRFKYKGDNWVAHSKGLNMKFSELKKIINSGAKERQDIKKMTDLEELTRQHATYFIKIAEKYYSFKSSSNKTDLPKQEIALKNYVLIIDEINRANLSSVLGELIYAFEYRGEAVESMYTVEGENKLILPPNLYIIGTMNTADRSVGHIDYAIRRRFAFVDVLPKDLSEEEGILFDSQLFYKVSELFDTNLSPEFEKKDVQLGHSYFIDKSREGGNMAVRLQYEIKPILLEYVKDGVLIGENIKQKIENLKKSI